MTIEPTPEPLPARRDLHLIRLVYFLWLGGSGFLWPFLNLFYVRLGLSGVQVGWISALASLVGLVSAPLWSSAAHKRSSARPTSLVGMQIFNGLSLFWLGMQSSFVPILGVTFLRATTVSGISPMSDALAIAVIGATQTGYGSVRIWASAGWVVFTLCAGWLIQTYGIQVAFWGSGLTALGAAAVLFFIRAGAYARPGAPAGALPDGSKPDGSKPDGSKPDGSKPDGGPAASPSASLGAALQTILASPPLLGAALMMLASGLGNNGILQFENVYLSRLGASEGLLGVAGVLSAIVEIPFMLLADRLLRRGAGPFGRPHGIPAQRLLLLSLLITGSLRLFVLFVPSIATIMLARAINGIGFSFYTIALVKFLTGQSPSEQHGVILALYTVTLVGLIGLVGSPLSGAFYDAFPTRWLYLLAGLGYGLGALLLWGGVRQPSAAR
jgi:MFS family permease